MIARKSGLNSGRVQLEGLNAEGSPMIPKLKPEPVDPRAPYLFKRCFTITDKIKAQLSAKKQKQVEYIDVAAHFNAHYCDEIDEAGWAPRDAVKTVVSTTAEGVESTVWVMPNGIAICKEGRAWSAWETLDRVARNNQHGRWASFARGGWTLQVPLEAGVYPVVAREAALPPNLSLEATVDFTFRRLALIEGVVCDVTHYRPTARRSEWRGYWWSEPLPELLAPTIGDKE